MRRDFARQTKYVLEARCRFTGLRIDKHVIVFELGGFWGGRGVVQYESMVVGGSYGLQSLTQWLLGMLVKGFLCLFGSRFVLEGF